MMAATMSEQDGSKGSARNRGGVQRVEGKLRASVEKGDYYEAHQMYRTLFFRYMSQNKYSEARELMYSGALLFFSHNQQNSAADLSMLVLESLEKSEAKVTDELLVKIRRAPRYLCPIDEKSSSSGGESEPLPRVFMDREGNDNPVIRRQQRRASPIIENELNEEEELQNPNLEDEAEIQVENYHQDGEGNIINEEREEVAQDYEIEQVLVQEEDLEDIMQEEEVDREVHGENSSNDSSDTINYDWVPEDQNILINKKQLLEVLKKAEKGLKENYSSLHEMRLKIEKM